jgi:hypothetical protein
MILMINTSYFPKQDYPTDLCNREIYFEVESEFLNTEMNFVLLGLD